MHKRGVMALALAVVTFGSPVAARAGPSGDAWTDDKGIGAGANTSGGTTATTASGGKGGSTGQPVCTYRRLSDEDAATADQLAESGLGPSKGAGEGAWYRKVCTDSAGNSTATVIWAPAPPAASPSEVAENALSRAPIPLPPIRMNPPPDRDQLVNLTTWLWLEGGWAPVSTGASAGGLTVTATATPERVEWNMGDGSRVVCRGPGTAYDPSRPSSQQEPSCSHTYRRSSAGQPDDRFRVTATSYWHATWTAQGAAAGEPSSGDLGMVRRSSSIAVRVAEAQALNTSQ